MSIQISNVLIWQKNGILRNLEFEKNKVNVITGDSGKGKSSILFIIDYCLLASSASGISKENIDNKSEWYGVRLWTSKGIITIARPAFHKKELSEVYFNDFGDIPETPRLNMTRETLKKVLDKEFGLNSDMIVPFGGKTIKAGSRISFRNFLAFCYQDQNTLVAPSYLYIRPNDIKLVERIERTFRMAIGILDAEGTLVHERLEKLKAKREILSRSKLAYSDRVYEFQDDLLKMANEAVNLGLIDHLSANPTESLNELKKLAIAPFDQFAAVNEELKELEQEEFNLTMRLKRFSEFTREYSEYQKLLKESDDSLSCISYLRSNYEELIPSGSTLKILETLEQQLGDIKSSWKSGGESILFTDVKDQEREVRKRLLTIKEQISSIKSKSDKTSSPEKIYRYQGRLEAKVELYSIKAAPVQHEDKLADIDNQILELQGKVEEMEINKDFILMELNAKINLHLHNLKLKGYENGKAIFSERLKAVNLSLDEGRASEKMEDIGSASNYLYVHLAYFMALHEVARMKRVPWMPSFLILDQVSTPYSNETPDDIESLDAALKEINKFVSDMDEKGGMQVILMEHIRESHWENLKLDKYRLVDKELRGSYGLIQ